ncbi:4253_t:CDS:2 [Funneliformis caledonium]|uniref:4253_t:CDS:1 n=1 Tax=Funneliformis caledonium TaxID=1117310 RepID=A0A9N9EY38_9GLOM|nr:4253_t:CDS:2 [Funneliformis caledonium]
MGYSNNAMSAMLRKCKSKENETPDKRENCCTRDRENKIKKKASETAEQCKTRLNRENKRKQTADKRLNRQEQEKVMQRFVFVNPLYSY